MVPRQHCYGRQNYGVIAKPHRIARERKASLTLILPTRTGQLEAFFFGILPGKISWGPSPKVALRNVFLNSDAANDYLVNQIIQTTEYLENTTLKTKR